MNYNIIKITKEQSGSILILALWVILLLSIVLIPVASYINKSIGLVKRIETRQILGTIAEAAIKKAINYLKFNDDSPDYDSLKDTWADNIVEFKDMEIFEGTVTISYTHEGVTYYGLMDEERKLYISDEDVADEDTLKQLFLLEAGVYEYDALSLAHCLIDWRDEDDVALTYGAENAYYESLSYSSKNQEIKVLEELLFIKGFTQDICERIYPFISVYHSGKININTAGQSVLLSLGLLSATVDDILIFRRGPDGIEGTLDDNVFVDTATILDNLGMLPTQDSVLDQLISDGKIDTSSTRFHIEVEATLPNTSLAKKVICVIDRDGETHYSYGYFFYKEQ